MLCSRDPPGGTHHVDGVDVGELREELTAAERELGVGLEELLSVETNAGHNEKLPAG